MTKPNDGGQAFPVTDFGIPQGMIVTDNQKGLTIRDYFAGQAVMGYLMAKEPFDYNEDISRWCYELADAMIKQREVNND